ncbi:hypothetical protein BTM312_03950 [Helicobacter pylori]
MSASFKAFKISTSLSFPFLQIRTTDMSKRPSNIIGEEAYAKVVDNICKSEMPQDNLGKKNQVTQDSLRKNLFVDMHRMGLIER